MNRELPPWSHEDASTGVRGSFQSMADAAGRARRQVDKLADVLRPAVLADLRLIVTELVTNSVRHGNGQNIELTIDVTREGDVHGCVSDGGRGRIEMVDRPAGQGGLGLLIVNAVSSRWGVTPASTDVWFELSAPSS
jgi:two-component sensor histidine kinase